METWFSLLFKTLMKFPFPGLVHKGTHTLFYHIFLSTRKKEIPIALLLLRKWSGREYPISIVIGKECGVPFCPSCIETIAGRGIDELNLLSSVIRKALARFFSSDKLDALFVERPCFCRSSLLHEDVPAFDQ